MFAGQSDASFDAWDSETGKHLWQFETPAGFNTAPITYKLANGKQYVAVVAGGSRYVRRSRDDPPEADSVIAFALP